MGLLLYILFFFCYPPKNPLKKSGVCSNISFFFLTDWVMIPGKGLLRKCPICCKTFAQSTSMKRHIQATHIKNSAATCPICGKICKNKYTMWVHRSKKHRMVMGREKINDDSFPSESDLPVDRSSIKFEADGK